MENASGASWEVSLTFPYQIHIENIWKMFLKPPGQFPAHVLIKFLLKTYEKFILSLLGSFLYMSLLNVIGNQKKVGLGPPEQFPVHFLVKIHGPSMENCSRASRAVSFTFPS